MKKYFFLLFLSIICTGVILSATMSAELCPHAIELRRLYHRCPGLDYSRARAIIKDIETNIGRMHPAEFVDSDQLRPKIVSILVYGFIPPRVHYLSHTPTPLEEKFLRERDVFFNAQTDAYLGRLLYSSLLATPDALKEFVFTTIRICLERQLREMHLLPPDVPVRPHTTQRSYQAKSHEFPDVDYCTEADRALAMEIWSLHNGAATPAASDYSSGEDDDDTSCEAESIRAKSK